MPTIALGLALAERGKLDDAIAALRESIRINPKWSWAHNNLGVALKKMGKLDKAIVEFKKAIELDPKHSRAHNNLGNALHDQGKVDEAVAAYQKALAIEPQDALGHNELAWLLATCPNAKFHDAKRAVELAMRAVELKPQEGTCWNTLGVAHYRAGNWKDAVAGLEKSMELRKGGDAYDWFFLAMADWQLGRKKQARKWYDQAVAWADKNEPKNEELRRFRAEAAELLAVPVEVGPAPREKK